MSRLKQKQSELENSPFTEGIQKLQNLVKVTDVSNKNTQRIDLSKV